jgi:flavodoxin
MSYVIIYSSATGNTKKVAYEILKAMPEDTKIYDLQELKVDVEEENLILGYWVHRAKPNKEMLHFMETLSDKKVITFGTLGAYPDSEHGEATKKNVTEILETHNTVLGNFLCQGKINPKITEMFKKSSGDSPHQMTEERLKRHQEAAKHPNEEDFEAARVFIKEILESKE